MILPESKSSVQRHAAQFSFGSRILAVLFSAAALLCGSALGQVPEALECAEVHIEAGQEQRLFCVPEEADASWTYQWQSEWPVALGYLSSAAESRPVLRIPQDAAAGLHVYTLTVEDALGRVIHTGRQEVVVHAAGFCDADGPVKGLGQAAFLCDEPDEADVFVAERILEVQLTDDVVGDAGPPLELDCEPHLTAETGSEASIACHGHGVGMLEYTAEFDWPPYVQTQVLGEGTFTFTILPPQIDAELEARPVRLTARDLSTGRSVTREVTLTVVNVEPVLQCEDLAATSGERVTVRCSAASAEGLPVQLQFLPRQELDGVPEGVFEEAPWFVAPEVTSDTAVEMVVRAIEAETNRVAETSFVLRIAPHAPEAASELDSPDDGAGFGTTGKIDPLSVSCTAVSVTEGTQQILRNCLITGGTEARRPYTYSWTGSTHLLNSNRLLATFDATDISLAERASETHTITLRVTDPTAGPDNYVSDSFTLTVVDAPNISANCKEYRYSPNEGQDGGISFDCSANATGNPDITWSWTGDLELTGADTATPTVVSIPDVDEDTDYFFEGTASAIGYDPGTVNVTVAVKNRVLDFACSDATITKNEGDANFTVGCSASANDDGSPTITYAWSGDTGPLQDDIAVASPTFFVPKTVTIDETYLMTLTASDGDAVYDSDEIEVTVVVRNLVSISVNCNPKTYNNVFEGGVDVEIRGCSVRVADNSTPTYTWSWESDLQLRDDDTATPIVVMPTDIAADIGYTVTATVSAEEDGYIAGTATVNVNVKNRVLDFACSDATITKNEGDANFTVGCSASANDDGSPTITYAWSGDTGPLQGKTDAAIRTFNVPNTVTIDETYRMTLTASDGDANPVYDSDEIKVTVVVQNVDQQISVTCAPATEMGFEAGDDVEIRGCSVSVADDSTPTYMWSWESDLQLRDDDTVTPIVVMPTDMAADIGYAVTATVSAEENGYIAGTATVNVNVKNRVLDFACSDATITKNEGDANFTVGCSASANDDGSPTITYAWSGDTGPLQGNTGAAIRTFNVPDDVLQTTTYDLTLTASDGDAVYDSDEIEVTVVVLNLVSISINCNPNTYNNVFEGDDDIEFRCTAEAGDNSTPTFMWSWSGDLTDDKTATPVFDVPDDVDFDTKYRFTVWVKGGDGYRSGETTVNVKVKNRVLDFACSDATITKKEGDENFTVGCSASANTGSPTITYAWSGDTGPLQGNTGAAIRMFNVPNNVLQTTTYDLTLTASDGDANPVYDSDEIEVTVVVQNVDQQISVTCAPATDMGFEAGDDVEISGCSVSVADNSTPTYTWSWESDLQLEDDDTATPSVVMPTEMAADIGYTVTATVSAEEDGYIAGTATVDVTVKNRALDFACSDSEVTVDEGDENFTVGCSASANDDGSPTITYAWSGDTGPLQSDIAVAIRMFNVPNNVLQTTTYDLTLTASDGDANPVYDSDEIEVTVVVQNLVDISVNCDPNTYNNVFEGGVDVKISGCSVSVADNSTPTYMWSWESDLQLKDDDTATPIVVMPTEMAADIGYTVTATVSAEEDGYIAGTATVNVTVKNRVLDFACSDSEITVDEGDANFTVGCSASANTGSPTITYAWSGDTGPLQSDIAVASPTFNVPDDVLQTTTYDLTLTASDGDANPVYDSGTVDVSVTVENVGRQISVNCTGDANRTVDEGADDLALSCWGEYPSTGSEPPNTTYAWTSDDAGAFELLTSTTSKSTTFEVPDEVVGDKKYTYTITATSEGYVNGSTNIVITVRDAVPLAVSCSDVSVYEGTGEHALACTAQGTPEGTTYAWEAPGSSTDMDLLTVSEPLAPVFAVPTSVEDNEEHGYRITVTAEDVSVTGDVTVTVLEKPDITVSCTAATDVLEGTGTTLRCSADDAPGSPTYTWSWTATKVPAGSSYLEHLSPTNSATPTFTAPSLNQDMDVDVMFTAMATAENADAGTRAFTVTVRYLRVINLSCDPDMYTSVEDSEAVQLVCGVTNPPANTTYSWEAVEPTADTEDLEPTGVVNPKFVVPANLDATKTYTYTLTASGPFAEDVEEEVRVTVTDRPDIEASCADVDVQEGAATTVTFDCSASGLAAGTAYGWSWNPVESLEQADIEDLVFRVPASVTKDSVITYTAEVTAPGGDPATATVTVTVRNIFELSLSCDPDTYSVQEGSQNITLACEASGGPADAAYSYAWVVPTDTDLLMPTDMPNPTFRAPDNLDADETYTYRLTASSPHAVSDAIQDVTVTVTDRPNVNMACDFKVGDFVGNELPGPVYEGGDDFNIRCTDKSGGNSDLRVTGWTWAAVDQSHLLLLAEIGNYAHRTFQVPEALQETQTYEYQITGTAPNADPTTFDISFMIHDRPDLALDCDRESVVYVGDADISVGCPATSASSDALSEVPDYLWEAVTPTMNTNLLSATNVAAPTFSVPEAAADARTYHYRLTAAADGWDPVHADFTVTVHENREVVITCPPVADVYEETAAFNLGCTASGAADGVAYQWSWDESNAPHDQLTLTATASPLFTVPAVTADETYSYVATVTAGGVDAGTETVSFRVLERPDIAVTCTEPQEPLKEGRKDLELPCKAMNAPGAGTYSWNWERTEGTNDLTATIIAKPSFIVPDVDAATAFTYTVTATADNADAGTETVTVTVLDEPMIPLECPTTEYEAYKGGTPVQVDCLMASDPEEVSYTWQALGTSELNWLLITTKIFAPTLTMPADAVTDRRYSFSLVMEATDAKQLLQYVHFTALEKPDIMVTCEDVEDVEEGSGAFDFACTASGAPGDASVYTWDWDPTDLLTNHDSATPEFDVPDNVDADTEYSFTVTVTADNANSGTATVSFSVLDASSVTVSCTEPLEPLREGRMPLELPCSADGSPGAGPYTWLWERSDGTGDLTATNMANPSFTAPDVDETTAFTYTVTASATDADAGETTVTVTVLDEPMIPLVCASEAYEAYEGGEDVQVQCSLSREVPGLVVQWLSIGTNANMSLVLNRSALNPYLRPPPSVTADQVHTYTMIVSATDAYSLILTIKFTVLEKPDIMVRCEDVEDVEEGSEAFDLACTASGAPGDAPVYTWDWGESPDGLSGTDDGSPTFDAPDNVDADTEYSFTVTVTADNADAGTATVSFDVLDRPNVTVSCTEPLEPLREGRMPLELPCSADGSPGAGPYTWLWERSDGTGDLTATNMANPSFTAPDVDETTAFTYTVTASATDADAGETTVTVTVLDEPMIPLVCASEAYEAYEGGEDVQVQCSLSREVPGLVVQWLSIGTNANMSLVLNRSALNPYLRPPPSVTADQVHTYTMIVSATDAYSLILTIKFTVLEKPDIMVRCEDVEDVEEGSEAFDLACTASGAPGDAPVYTWDWGESPDGLSGTDDGSPTFDAPDNVDADTEYSFTVTVTADNADAGTATVSFNVLDS